MRHLVVVATALLVGCSAGDFGREQPLFTVSVQSPVGGTFTATQRNAFGAGGGVDVQREVPLHRQSRQHMFGAIA